MNRKLTAGLLFGLALLLPCSAARAAEKEYRWGFDAGQVVEHCVRVGTVMQKGGHDHRPAGVYRQSLQPRHWS